MKKTRRRALYIIAALLAALFVLSCLVGFAACGGGSNDPEEVPGSSEDDDTKKDDDQGGTTATISSVSVTPATLSLTSAGAEGKITASVTMSSGTYTGSYTWKSSDEKVATVSGSGATATVTAVAQGSANVTVTVGEGTGAKTATCAVSVSISQSTPEPEPEPEPTISSVSLSSASLSIEYASSRTSTLTATVTMSDNSNYEGSYAWTSSDTSIVTVSGSGSTATVTALKCGTATVTVTVDDEKTATCTVTVSEDHTAAEAARVSQTEESSDDLKAGQNASGQDIAFDATDITVSYDETTKTYTVNGVAETFGYDLATAFYGNNATKGEAHKDCQYITFTLAVNAGETMKITCTNGTDDTKVRMMYGSDIADTDKDSSIQEASDGTWVIDLDDHFSETEGCDWKMELEVAYAGGDKVTYTVVFGDIEKGVADATDLQAAINEGGEVALTEDIELESSLTIGGSGSEDVDVLLDLNGNDLTCEGSQKGDHTIIVKAGATLTVTGEGTVDADGADDTAALYNEGTVILEGGFFTRSVEAGEQEKWVSGQNSYYTVENHGDMTIEDGATVFNAGDYSTCLKSSSEDANNPAKLTINGGLIYGGKYAVKNDYSGILIMTGGQLGGLRSETDTLPYRALQNWDNATITGGTLLGGNGGASDTDTAADGAEAEGVVIYNNTAEQSNTDNLGNVDRSEEVGTLTIGDENGNGPEIIYEGVNAYAAEPIDNDVDETPKFATGVAIDSGTVKFQAGTIKCSDTAEDRDYNFVGVYLTNGALNVSGGTISGDEAIVIDCAEDDDATVSATITGGTFVGGIWSYVTSDESGSVTVDDSLNLVKVAYDASGTVIEDETAEGAVVDHYVYRDQIECDTVGHVLVGTYADGSWTYVCSECGDAIGLGEGTLVSSLTLEAMDYDSLKAACTWNDIQDMSLTIHVVTTDENNGAISVTGNFGLRYGEKTIVLDADIDMGSSYTIIVLTTVVLDLNGHSISRTGDTSVTTGVVQVGQYNGGNSTYEYGDLTVKDSSTNQSGKISGSYGVTVFGGSVDNTDGSVSKFTLESGSIEGSVLAISTNGSTRWGAEEIIIQGGTVSGGEAGIYLPSGSLTVSGGEISGATGIEIKASSATISGGKISTTVEDGQTSVNKETGTTDTSGFSIAIIAGSEEGAYKDMISVSISGNVDLTGDIYVDSSIDDNVVNIDTSLKDQVVTDADDNTEPDGGDDGGNTGDDTGAGNDGQ